MPPMPPMGSRPAVATKSPPTGLHLLTWTNRPAWRAIARLRQGHPRPDMAGRCAPPLLTLRRRLTGHCAWLGPDVDS
jgi:hypothetical protein